MKKQRAEDKLLTKYGQDTLDEAVQYFLSIDKHCIISELEEMCDYIKRMREGRE